MKSEVEVFNNALALLESGGQYQLKNAQGYVGRYQMGQDRIDDFNRVFKTRYSVDDVLASPELQEKLQNWHVADIDRYIDSSGLNKLLGQDFSGVRLSRNSFRAVAHLGGKKGLRKFLLSNGIYDPADSNGTRLSHYAVDFANIHDAPDGGGVTQKNKSSGQGEGLENARSGSLTEAAHEALHPKEAQEWASRDSTLGRHLPIGERSGLKYRMDGQTSAQSLSEIIAWLDVENSARYAADEEDTYCNIYALDFCYLSGAYLPRVWWNWEESDDAEAASGDGAPIEMTANSILAWLKEFGARFGWRMASDLTEIQAAANKGHCSLILAQSPAELHGHIAVVCPETATECATRVDGEVLAPVQSQTLLVSDQGRIDPQWWLKPQFIDFGFWYHDRQTGRSELLRPGRVISWITKRFFPAECEFLDAKLSICRDEVARVTRLPDDFLTALVAGEDKRFYRHPGFDLIAIFRAISRICLHKKIEGASTIEQQLVRTFTGRRERKLRRKLGEILLAMRYSSALDKETIAAIYLENAYFGWRATGCRNALKRPEFTKNTELETAAWLVASLRYPVASTESDNRRRVRQDRVKFILDRIEKQRKRAK